MKKIRKITCLIFSLLIVLILSACGSGDYFGGEIYLNGGWNTGNVYNEISENPFALVSEKPISSFAMDANTAAYSNIRRYINEYRTIDKNQVRIEEMVNYFHYNYDAPNLGEDLSLNGTISPCPWNSEAKLLTIGVRAKDIEFTGIQNNLVFLMDISGSMDKPDKMPLMQAAFCLLSENLNDNDIVSIVAYAGSNRVVLDGASGFERKRIQNAIEDLMAGGSTAGAQGINTAYQIAEKHFIAGENNRIIWATDGDFNVGISSQEALKSLIEEKSSTGIDLTVMGFGYGNLQDAKLDTIVKAAGGNYFYVDGILEARRVLVDQIEGSLVTVAKNVKAQVEFNPNKIYSYRLLGYENKLLTKEDFDNPNKPAGDIGSGHCVTAVYEIILNIAGGSTNPLGENFIKISLNYNDPSDSSNYTISAFVDSIIDFPNDDVLFISAVVEAALVMRKSEYRNSASLQNVITRLESIGNLESDPYKLEFLSLIRKLTYY